MAELDLPGTFSSSITDTDTDTDIDANNVSLLREQLKEVDRLIAEHNTFDSINIPAKPLTIEGKAILFDEMFNHRQFVHMLRGFRNDLSKKVEELTNG